MAKKPNITRERERELAILAQAGDTDARNELVMAHYAFVVWIAGRYTNKGADTEELIQNGMIGLMEAVQKFDPDRGTRLLTMAFWSVRRHIIEAIKSGSIYSNNKFNRTSRLVRYSLDGTLPEEMKDNRRVVSLDQMVEREEPQTLGSTLEDKNAEDPFEAAAEAELSVNSELNLRLLKKRTRKIVEMRLGRGKKPGMSFTSIAASLGISAERVRRIFIKAIKNLREGLGDVE